MSEETKEKEIDSLELMKILWSRKMSIIKWGIIGGIFGVIIAVSIPREYSCSTTMVPEIQTENSANSTVSQLASAAGFNIGRGDVSIIEKNYPEIVSSKDFILSFANIKFLHKNESTTLINYLVNEQKNTWWSYVISAPMQGIGWLSSQFNDDVKEKKENLSDINPRNLSIEQFDYIEKFRSIVNVNVNEKSRIIKLSVTTQSPEVALLLSDSVVSKLEKYLNAYKTSKTMAELVSNTLMLDEAKRDYNTADSLYSSAVDKNKNTFTQSATAKLERFDNERDLAFQIYKQIASQTEISKIKLNEIRPQITIIESATMPVIPSAPNKTMILFSFAFLGGFACAVKVLFPKFTE